MWVLRYTHNIHHCGYSRTRHNLFFRILLHWKAVVIIKTRLFYSFLVTDERNCHIPGFSLAGESPGQNWVSQISAVELFSQFRFHVVNKQRANFTKEESIRPPFWSAQKDHLHWSLSSSSRAGNLEISEENIWYTREVMPTLPFRQIHMVLFLRLSQLQRNGTISDWYAPLKPLITRLGVHLSPTHPLEAGVLLVELGLNRQWAGLRFFTLDVVKAYVKQVGSNWRRDCARGENKKTKKT